MKMTGKQALYDLIDEIKYTHNDGVSLTPFDQKRVDVIAKDLEVLEILKKLPFEMYENGGGDNWNWYIDLKESTRLTEEEKEKIKEWLKEE